jgi:hypothetical protein
MQHRPPPILSLPFTPYIGSRGWVALRLDVGEVDWDEVGELAAEATS